MAVLGGSADGVDWKVGLVLNDGALVPVFEFSRRVPHDHAAVQEAYLALLRCLQQVLGEAWVARAMCPVCHLPSSSPEPCPCCEQSMCRVCRARHDRGQGIPGTGEPLGSAGGAGPTRTGVAAPVARRAGAPSASRPLPGYA